CVHCSIRSGRRSLPIVRNGSPVVRLLMSGFSQRLLASEQSVALKALDRLATDNTIRCGARLHDPSRSALGTRRGRGSCPRAPEPLLLGYSAPSDWTCCVTGGLRRSRRNTMSCHKKKREIIPTRTALIGRVTNGSKLPRLINIARLK